MKLMLPIALIAAGCSPASSQEDGAPSGTAMRLSSRQVEAAHLEQLNAWIREQDRTNPPAPSVPKPSDFSEAECSAVEANSYDCAYSYSSGGTRTDATARFMRGSDGSWTIRAEQTGGGKGAKSEALRAAEAACAGLSRKQPDYFSESPYDACLIGEANKSNPYNREICDAAASSGEIQGRCVAVTH